MLQEYSQECMHSYVQNCLELVYHVKPFQHCRGPEFNTEYLELGWKVDKECMTELVR
jgi:hypothetical protein